VGRSTKSRFDRLAKNTGRSRAFLAANEDHPTLHALLAIAYQSKTIAEGDINTPVSSDRQPPSGGSFDDLKGLDVLMVEDSQDVGEAVRTLLESWGANVAGPAATTLEAASLVAQHLPDVALVDLHLKGGELSYGLIARLREQRVPVVMLSGSFEFFPLPSIEGTIMLEKPFSEAQLFTHLSRLYARKTG
jgi:CheY-like chemotaxis protein